MLQGLFSFNRVKEKTKNLLAIKINCLCVKSCRISFQVLPKKLQMVSFSFIELFYRIYKNHKIYRKQKLVLAKSTLNPLYNIAFVLEPVLSRNMASSEITTQGEGTGTKCKRN